jgi:YidC/Oxa1 family membrane protein insertase
VFSALYGVPVDAAYHIVSAVAGVLTPVLGGLAAAAAIVVFTMAVRLLVLPLSYRSTRGLEAQARIAPKAQALQVKHKNHPDRLQRELAALYQAEGTGMLAGCLPLLLQWPFLSIMYILFRSPRVGGKINTLLSHTLFGTTLGSHWLGGAGPLSTQGAVFAALFLLLAAIAYLSTRAARRLMPTPPPASTDPTTRATAAVAKLTPYGTVLLATFAPLAAVLYLATTAAWTLTERTLFQRTAKPADQRS